MKKKQTKIRPKAPAVGVQRPCSQFWVIDTGCEGVSSGTLEAHGPFCSQSHAESYILNISEQDWLTSCGCLREGNPLEWGDTYIIVREVRSVKPVPPSSVEMTLVDTANEPALPEAGRNQAPTL